MKIIADIGGTNARFALVDDKGNVINNRNYSKKDFSNITDAINGYKLIIKKDIKKAVIAINTPVFDGKPHINANNWGYESTTIEKDTGIDEVVFINDLLAHATAIPHISNNQKVKISGASPNPKGPIVVVGPGTGLGMSFGIFDNNKEKYIFNPSEGGSRLAAGGDYKQLDIISKILEKKHHVRWEDVISGQGIENIYEVLFNEEKTTEDIMSDLKNGSEKSKEAFNMVCAFLGLFARNAADIFLCSGGIYIIGGIFSRGENLEFLKESAFMDYYNITLPNASTYIKDYPIYVATESNLALIGLANY